eukprot:2045891-Pleurochrysis_carterae.AAC.1
MSCHSLTLHSLPLKHTCLSGRGLSTFHPTASPLYLLFSFSLSRCFLPAPDGKKEENQSHRHPMHSFFPVLDSRFPSRAIADYYRVIEGIFSVIKAETARGERALAQAVQHDTLPQPRDACDDLQ